MLEESEPVNVYDREMLSIGQQFMVNLLRRAGQLRLAVMV